MGNNHSPEQPTHQPQQTPQIHQQHHRFDPSTTTTAKAQALALLCAPVVAKRRPPTTPTTPPPSPSSLIRWAQSPAVTRAWARDWVLRPTANTVFDLPIIDNFLCVSVSPTLGPVSSQWFTRQGDSVSVAGCVGEGRVLVCNGSLRCLVVDVKDSGGAGGGGGVCMCDRLQSGREVRVDDDCGGKEPEDRRFQGVKVDRLQFSPLCDDVDLGASFSESRLVIKSRVECDQLPQGILWMPDGSTCTLHRVLADSITLKDTTSGHEIGALSLWCTYNGPQYKTVDTVGAHHIFINSHSPCFEFQVYSTRNLSSPSLRIKCLWASAGILPSLPTGLIASTSHQKVRDAKATDVIEFAVHDAATSFHIGDILIPVPNYVDFWGL
ncbi:hypothetical protein Pelo_3564 [Pelomyxa schiedti]|nr:hypothetical protein Pelo_3564 [Pelomyxa schiedti]